MDASPSKTSDGYFDATPYLRLVIDKEGRWFQNGAEIIHPGIYRQFCQMLEKSADGDYRVRMGREVCRVEVQDAPFVVRSVSEQEEQLFVHLNDESVEPLDPEHFWIGDEHVPYVTVKDGKFHARFSRPAYYGLARHIECDEQEQEFYLTIGGRRSRIDVR
jgi:uncharacterized protein